MPTLTAGTPAVELVSGGASVGGTISVELVSGGATAWTAIPGGVPATPGTGGPTHSVVVHDFNGAPLGVMEVGSDLTCGFIRNRVGDAQFTHSIFDATAVAHLPSNGLLGKEIAIYRNAELIWRGVPVAARSSLATGLRTVRCKTLEHPLGWRVFGRAERTNLWVNADFESGLNSWTTVGTTATVITSNVNTGNKAVRLSGAGHIYQTVTGITHIFDPGLAPRAAIYVDVPQAVIDGEGDGFVLVFLEANDGTNTYTETITIADVTRPGDYGRVSSDILLRADATWTIKAKLEGSAAGDIDYDTGLFTFDEATTVEFPGADLRQLVHNGVSHSQDVNYGKSSLGIVVDTTAAGITVLRGWAHSLHEYVWPALEELVREFNCDIWVGLDRVLYVRAKRGAAVAGMNVSVSVADAEPDRSTEMSALGLLGDITVATEIDRQYSAFIVAAEAPDFAAEEAGAVDTSGTGGVVKEKFWRAGPSARARDLQSLADSLLAAHAQPAALPTVPYTWAAAGGAEPGDTFTVDLSVGCEQMSGTFRIESWTYRARTDTVEVGIDLDVAA